MPGDVSSPQLQVHHATAVVGAGTHGELAVGLLPWLPDRLAWACNDCRACTDSNAKLATAVETCLTELRRVWASGGATGERSSYGPLANLLNAVGATLWPKVFCVAA